MRPAFSAYIRISLLPIVLIAQDYSVDPETTRNRAREIIKQCRESTGGEANLASVRSLQASGNFRAVRGGRDVQGELKIELQMPDKFMRVLSMTLGSKEITRIETINGDEVWTDAKGWPPMKARSGGGENILSTLPGGIEGSGNGMMEAMSREVRASVQRRLRAEFNQFLVAVLLAPAGLAYFNYGYEREVQTKEGKFDLLSVKGPDGFAIWLFVDQKIHRPWMLSYQAPAPRGSGGRQASHDENGEPTMIDYQCYFTDYKQVGQIWLPHHISKAADGQVIEEWKINRYKLNPEIKPSTFEKKR